MYMTVGSILLTGDSPKLFSVDVSEMSRWNNNTDHWQANFHKLVQVLEKAFNLQTVDSTTGYSLISKVRNLQTLCSKVLSLLQVTLQITVWVKTVICKVTCNNMTMRTYTILLTKACDNAALSEKDITLWAAITLNCKHWTVKDNGPG